MARDKGQKTFASNYEVKIAEMLDPRLLVDSKEELIKKETWPSDGDTLYMKEGMFVYVKGDGFYELVSLANILATDYSGWKKVTSGAEENSEKVSDYIFFSDILNRSILRQVYQGEPYTLSVKDAAILTSHVVGKVVVFYEYVSANKEDVFVVPYYHVNGGDALFTYMDCIDGEFVSCEMQINGKKVSVVDSTSASYQRKLVSGTNIKTINGESILGGGNIAVQSPLVNGTNIKTINGNGILGEGNLAVKAYYPKTFVTIDEFPESVTLIPTEYTIIETVIDGGFTISCKGSPNMNKRADEHLIRFSYSSGSISFGNNIRWQNDTAPTFKSGYTYEISILDNLACFAEFKTA